MIYKISIQYTVYCGLSFLTCIATVFPITRLGISFIIGGWVAWLIADTGINYARIEKERLEKDKKALLWAVLWNLPHFILTILAITIGFYLGIS
ncbi:MAG: hypothetical protein KME64_00945 [Scytonematopsis contorta HA4267-MV1]|jgi:hypothetical protein|nr:hypothetical protein [Scytonematopsis contorta HA4267-MV1]